MKLIIISVLWIIAIVLLVYVIPTALAIHVWAPLIWTCVPLAVALCVTNNYMRNRK